MTYVKHNIDYTIVDTNDIVDNLLCSRYRRNIMTISLITVINSQVDNNNKLNYNSTEGAQSMSTTLLQTKTTMQN